MSAGGGKCGKTHWIGLDGEGLGRTPHRYVLLAFSDVDGNSRSIQAKGGLGSAECFDFILSTPRDAHLCGYYLGYDWTMMLRDLPNRAIYRLCRPELRARPRDEGGGFTWVRWRGFKLHYLAGAMTIRKDKVSRTVWDVGKYFQSTFVEAIEKNEIKCARDMIAHMKDQRGSFQWRDFKRIKKYCLEECRALAELATNLDEQHTRVKVRPRAWYGPGSTAGTVLGSHGIDKLRGDPPADVRAAADAAFFGGRFEHSCIGLRSDVWGYDITSAYPNQTQFLPCLLHARWRHSRREGSIRSKDRYALVRYRVRDIGAKRAWGPLPCRLSSGSIVFARGGFSGWAWQDEYRVARENWDGIEFLEAWICEETCDCVPFGFVAELFRERLRNAAAAQILKFILNSLYGKLAQSVGRPKFASRLWAGMITSGTRAQLLELILKHSDERNVYALATDGVYSGEDLDVASKVKTLGGWEKKHEGEAWFVRPGIYWSDHTLRARGLGRKVFSRHRETFKEAILGRKDHVILDPVPQFGSARQHVRKLRKNGLVKRGDLYGEWHDVRPRSSLLAAPKRNLDWSLIMLDGVESRPYSKAPPSPDAGIFEKIAILLGDVGMTTNIKGG